MVYQPPHHGLFLLSTRFFPDLLLVGTIRAPQYVVESVLIYVSSQSIGDIFFFCLFFSFDSVSHEDDERPAFLFSSRAFAQSFLLLLFLL